MKDKFKEVLSKERDKEDLFTLDVPAGLRKELENGGTPGEDRWQNLKSFSIWCFSAFRLC